jgi:hypothetical protein
VPVRPRVVARVSVLEQHLAIEQDAEPHSSGRRERARDRSAGGHGEPVGRDVAARRPPRAVALEAAGRGEREDDLVRWSLARVEPQHEVVADVGASLSERHGRVARLVVRQELVRSRATAQPEPIVGVEEEVQAARPGRAPLAHVAIRLAGPPAHAARVLVGGQRRGRRRRAA